MLIPIISLSIVFAFIAIVIAIFFFVAAGKADPRIEIAGDDLPVVSILVAARNEEQNIIRCLQALTELDYPAYKLEILVGNDASEDKTRELVAAFAMSSCLILPKQLARQKAKPMYLHNLHIKPKVNIF